ncbi:hypothetical protein GCM10023091_37700 [Ravibacter arvi]|uniref:Probable endolytic peptidoglycan transglycosylase RlpA n=1 Tax=Ravibacter arvi TaxID=2051041 RepID=A0ABP8MA76_9BACT
MIYSTILLGFTTLLTLLSSPWATTAEVTIHGKASYYSRRFEGKKTAFGEVFRNRLFTAAHRTFPHNTLLEVVNLKNGRNVVVRVNDRGPWKKSHLIDVSEAAAKELGMIRSGVGDVQVRVVGAEGKLFEHERECLAEVMQPNSR